MRVTSLSFLDGDDARAWAELGKLDRARVLRAARNVVETSVGVRKAARDAKVSAHKGLVAAVARAVRDEGAPAPWAEPESADVAAPAGPPTKAAARAQRARARAVVQDEVAAEFVDRRSEALALLGEDVAAGDLTTDQALAVTMKATGSSIAEIAGVLDCHVSTVGSWTKLPAFARALARLLAERLESQSRRLQHAQERALGVLIDGLDATRPMRFGKDDWEELPDWATRQKCASELLDRGGLFLRGERIEMAGQVQGVSPERSAERLAEIDVELQEVEQEMMETEGRLLRMRGSR